MIKTGKLNPVLITIINYLIDYIMTFEDFKQDIFENIQVLPPTWRKGQKVFNYIEHKENTELNMVFGNEELNAQPKLR